MKTTAIISGTHCASCKKLIEDVCKEIAGVNSCEVDPQTGVTIIEHDERFNQDIFKSEIESLGAYKVQLNS